MIMHVQDCGAGLLAKCPRPRGEGRCHACSSLSAQATFYMSHHIPGRKLKQNLQNFPGNTKALHSHFLLKRRPFISIRHECLINSILGLPLSRKIQNTRWTADPSSLVSLLEIVTANAYGETDLR